MATSSHKNNPGKRPGYHGPSKSEAARKRKRNIYSKSRYYRQRRRRRIFAAMAALIVLLILIVFGISSCVRHKKDAVPADSSSVQKEASSKDDVLSTDNENKQNEDSGEEEEPAEEDPWSVSFTVSVVGDCTLGTDEAFDYSTSLNAYFDNYGSAYFLQNVKSIFEADDLTIANFEGTLTDSENRADKLFAFKAPASFAKILSDGCVEAVTTANNHSHDYGEDSFTDTLQALDAQGIVHFGYDETAVMDIKGIKVGLVGIYELNDHLERTQQLKDNIAKVKADGAQVVIVIFHWGNEKEDTPDDNQMTLGRLAIDEGADLVCGHHPHVLQGIETYKGKKIVYSLGNFCFGGNSAPSDMDTMIFQQTFTVTNEGVQTDDEINIIPCSISSAYGYNNYQPTPAEGEEADRIMQKIQERSSWIPRAETVSPPA